MGSQARKGRKTEKKRADPLEKQRLLLRHRAQVWDRICNLLKTVTVGVCWVFVSYFLFKSMEVLAGKTTIAMLSGLLEFSADRYVAYALVGIFGVGYLTERRTRRKLIRDTGPYIKSLEEKIDPARSSSRLLTDGKPRKEDRE